MTSTSSGLPAEVLEERKRLKDGMLTLRAQHDSGSAALEISHGLADLSDRIVTNLYDLALQSVPGVSPNGLALVAHGGYGRRDVSPY
ncbi:MAG TPA: hypothetical protein DCF63_07685 [Planctomycetaceae bacterium]|nr:hypothetical protein [Planctomycetaceae bacterium]